MDQLTLNKLVWSVYHFQVIIGRVNACEQGCKSLNAENDGVIEEEVVRVVVVAKLLVAPEQDHAQVVVETETAAECGQVRAAISFLENLKKKNCWDWF